jgi:hypothetical protein
VRYCLGLAGFPRVEAMVHCRGGVLPRPRWVPRGGGRRAPSRWGIASALLGSRGWRQWCTVAVGYCLGLAGFPRVEAGGHGRGGVVPRPCLVPEGGGGRARSRWGSASALLGSQGWRQEGTVAVGYCLDLVAGPTAEAGGHRSGGLLPRPRWVPRGGGNGAPSRWAIASTSRRPRSGRARGAGPLWLSASRTGFPGEICVVSAPVGRF